MDDEAPTPFSPFLPSPAAPATTETPAEKPKTKRGPKKGSKRAKRAVKSAPAPAAAEAPPKRQRKPRTPRPATVSIDLLVVASGLDEKAAQVFAGVVQALSQLRKPSRRKLVEALQKLS